MNKQFLYILLPVLLFTFSGNISAQEANRFFNAADLMTFGTYYYPEQWDESQWERDVKKMADLGFDFTHYGEFAWSRMEPEEGKFDFTWLDKSVALAKKYGLKVIMCTPTPTPPAWLTSKYPDILMVNDMGMRIEHGARAQASWSSKIYREYVTKIVTELGRRYGNDETIIGWQIDNEPSHYGQTYDYSENAQVAFREWLKKKYNNDIKALNDNWGNAFWSQTYNNFEQIRIPNQKVLAGTANPHAMLDYRRFQADEVAYFINFQTDILRKYISPKQWVTTNTRPNDTSGDPTRMDHLDFLTYTRYLVVGRDNGHGKQGFRIASSHMLGYNNDTYRNYPGKIYGVMELQPAQVNWGSYNPQTYPGAVRLWLYHIFAGGGKFVCNYRFRQPLKGSEQYHYGMIGTDGVTPSVGGREYMQVFKEMDIIRANYDKNAKIPEEVAKRRAAILFSSENEWEMQFQPQSNQWKYKDHIHRYYKSLKSFGSTIDIISEKDNFNDYPLFVVPAYQLIDKELVKRWKEYAEKGGNLIVTCRTGLKTRDSHLWEAKQAEPIYDLIGASDMYFDHMPPNEWGSISMDGKTYKWNNWADVVTPVNQSDVWAKYEDQFYKGAASVIHRKVGKGTVTYIGIDSDDEEIEKDVLRKVYSQANVNLLDLPSGVLVEWRDGFFVGLNYTSEEQTLTIPQNAKILVGSKTIPPAGVVVWK